MLTSALFTMQLRKFDIFFGLRLNIIQPKVSFCFIRVNNVPIAVSL